MARFPWNTAAVWARPALVLAAVPLLAASMPARAANGLEFAFPQRFHGTALTTVLELDEYGNLLERYDYELPVLVLVGPPTRFGRQMEDNPFHLEIAPGASGTAGSLGMVTINSAEVTGDLIERYWTLDAEGNAFRGSLTQEERDTMSLILDEENLLNTRRVDALLDVPTVRHETMALDSWIQGTLAGERIEIHIEGNVLGGDRPFATDIVATLETLPGMSTPPPPPAAAAPAEGLGGEATGPAPQEPAPPAPGAGDDTAPPAANPLDATNPLDAINPLDTATDPLVGTFADAQLTVELWPEAGRYGGRILLGDQVFPLQAEAVGGGVVGTFESGGRSFPFDAVLEQDTLTLTTGSTVYILDRRIE